MIKKIKEFRNLKKGTLIGLLVLLSLVVIVPLAFSYLSSSQEQGIALRTTPASEIWDIQGNFNIDSWKKNNASGITIHNKSPRDLWIFFEYNGDLKQIFKHSDPVLIKAGATQELSFAPLDDKDSPRLLNPLDLIQNYSTVTGGKCGGLITWRIFTGTVKIHTLNQYANLETPPINIPGDALWKLFFLRKLGVDPQQYCQQCWDEQKLKIDQVTASTPKALSAAASPTRQLNGEKLIQAGDSALKDTQQVLSDSNAYQPAIFIEEVMQAVEQIAPGLWDDRQQLLQGYYQFKERLSRLNDLLVAYKEEVKHLNQVILNQEDQIYFLQDEIDELQQNNAVLQDEHKIGSGTAGSSASGNESPAVSSESGTAGSEGTAASSESSAADSANPAANNESSAASGGSTASDSGESASGSEGTAAGSDNSAADSASPAANNDSSAASAGSTASDSGESASGSEGTAAGGDS